MDNGEAAGSRRIGWEAWLIVVLGVYFIGRLLYFAFTVGHGVPPDESTHVEIIRLYASVPFLIEDSPASFHLGLVSHLPHLYYFLLGKLAALFGADGYLFLRLINVIMAAGSLFLSYRLAVELCPNPRVRLLAILLMTNVLMYTFISPAVNYDNLANLLSVCGFYFLVRHARGGSPRHLLAFFVSLCLGMLSKGSFLMLIPLFGVVWLCLRRSSLKSDLAGVVSETRSGNKGVIALLLLLLVSVTANLLLYGTNILRYGAIVPSCQKVLELEQCMQNRIFARNWIVAKYRDGTLDYRAAMASTIKIKNPGDRQHAMRLLNNERMYRNAKPPVMNPYDYLVLLWDQALKPTIFGIQAHQSLLRPPDDLAVYSLILFAALLLFARGVRSDGEDRLWLSFAFVSAGYVLILICYYNYRMYLGTHAPFIGVQGRYLFHVLVPVALLVAEFLLRLFGPRVQLLIILLVGGWFIAGDLPYYLEHSTDAWGKPYPTAPGR